MTEETNTGKWNTGCLNTGYLNTGSKNTGKWNTGNENTGNANTGNKNTGKWNTADKNAGDLNIKNENTGDGNTGYLNTGDGNTGGLNTGCRNAGYRNTGSWNTCGRETGFFNTIQSKTIRVFNKECSIEEWENADEPSFIYKVNPTQWISKSEMTDEEKNENPTYKTTGGYLREFSYKEAWGNAYDNATKEDIELLKKLPNFDAEVFKEISGIDISVCKVEELTMEQVCKELGRDIKIKK
jgi:hypothetical protein